VNRLRVKHLAMIVVTLMLVFGGSVHATTVSGIVTLPAEVAAYEVDKSFSVTLAYEWNNGWPQQYHSCGSFWLAAQQRAAHFSCEIEDAAGDVAVYVYSYDWDGVYHGPHFYNSAGTVITPDAAERLANGTIHDIALPLLRGITITGELRLPPGSEVFDEVKTLVISFYHQGTSQYGHTVWYSSGYHQDLPAGADHLDYSLNVPGLPNPVKIGYSWPWPYDNAPEGYVSHGYYHPAGTVYERDPAAEISTATSLSDRHMTILPGIPLHGTLRLPDGVLNSQEMTVDIRAVNTNWSINQTRSVTIPADTPFAPFSFYLPPGQQVRLEYTSMSGADRQYITPGYYRPDGTSADPWPQSWVSTDGPTPHIDFPLLPGVAFSGKIYLPDGPHLETISGNISIQGANNFYEFSQFSIAAGEVEADWSLVFPPTTQNVTVETYLYTHQYDPGPEFLRNSYFNTDRNNTAGIRKMLNRSMARLTNPISISPCSKGT
jgi:hypothetical protein